MNDADGMSAERQPAGEEGPCPEPPAAGRVVAAALGGRAAAVPGAQISGTRAQKKTALNAPGPKSNGIRHLPRHGERSCLFILRRSRQPECPVRPIPWSDLAETAPFRLFPAGRDSRNVLRGRFYGATSLKQPHFASSREVATPGMPCEADSMERPR